MAQGMPSMTALLGLLAIAGYQHKDKIAEMLGGAGQGGMAPAGQGGSQGGLGGGGQGGSQGGLGGMLGGSGQGGGLGGLLGGLGGAGAGGLLSGGLRDLVDRFTQNGHGEVAQSWVGTGQNREVAPHQLEQAIGSDVLATLSEKTGLSRGDLLSRLSRELPHAVDKYTPDGRLPG